MVHRRLIDGEPEVFGNQGALWGNAMTWWDHSTGSVWSQPKGEAIMGPRTGEVLELLPSTLTTWRAWRTSHPDTQALAVHGWETGFELEDMAIVVELGSEAVAYPIPDARTQVVIDDVVGGVPVSVVVDPHDGERWAVFSRTIDDGVVVDLQVIGDAVVDVATGGAIDPFTGVGRGALAGTQLDRVSAFTVFPLDFATFFPDGHIWDGS